jgi:TRAP-type uncharacterized transport system substrate-binding protein
MTIDNPVGPTLDRPIDISFMGDWGLANLTQVARWLQHTLIDRAGEGSKSVIHWGTGGADGLRAVGAGDVDVAVVTPAAFARMALNGTGAFEGQAMPELRAIGVIPQDDRLLFVANERLGVSTLSELSEHPGPWVLGTCANNGNNLIGYAAERLLADHGLDRMTRDAKGVTNFFVERPSPLLDAFRDGEIDLMVMEGISIPTWEQVWEQQPGATVLKPDADVLERVEKELGWPSRPVTKGWWSQRELPDNALDFSDFLVVTTTDLEEDIAHVITWCMFETIPLLERNFAHIEPKRSGITYPLRREAMADAPIPLHDGALRYLAETNGG